MIQAYIFVLMLITTCIQVASQTCGAGTGCIDNSQNIYCRYFTQSGQHIYCSEFGACPQCTCACSSMCPQQCSLCPADTYKDNSLWNPCIPCPTGHKSPPGSTSIAGCIMHFCSAGYTGPHFQACSACVAGTYKNSTGSSVCTLCGNNTYSTVVAAISAAVCTTCPSRSTSFAGSDDISKCVCNAGSTGPNGISCVLCSAGKYKNNNGFAACTNCSSGTYSASIGASTCTSCATGKYKENAGPGECMGCMEGKYQAAAGATVCVDCTEGKYQAHVGSSACADCPSHSTSGPGSALCICNSGYSNSNNETCIACASGKYKEIIGPKECVDCSKGKYQAKTGATVCVDCIEGKYQAAAGATVCVDCTEGKYQADIGSSTCIACIGDFQTPTGSIAITACVCPVGYSNNDGASCAACLSGTYKDVIGNISCTTCAVGTYSTNTAATTGSTCLPCQKASNSPAGSSLAIDCICNVGHTGANAGPCVACVAGKYKEATGSAECAICLAGTYSTTVGATMSITCELCPVNSNSIEGSFALDACKCNRGATGPDGGLCIECEAGKYKNVSGAGACMSCPFSSTSPAGSVSSLACVCVAGSYSSTNRKYVGTGCSNSRMQYWMYGSLHTTVICCYANGTSTRSDPNGCFSTIFGNINYSRAEHACQTSPWNLRLCRGSELTGMSTVGDTCDAQCGGNWINSWVDFEVGEKPSCIPCEAGTYKNSDSDEACTACPANSASPEGSTGLRDCICNAGWTGPNGEDCVACVPGSYKTINGSTACTMCANNTYSNMQASVSSKVCVECPSHSTSVAGSDDVSRCFCVLGFEQTLNHTACLECTQGYYDDRESRYACSKCQGGYFSAGVRNIGIESCQACPAGTWSNNLTASCQPCPSNSHSPPSTTYIESCTCNAGATGADGQTCVLCIPGKYKPSTGSLACQDCSAGTYSVHYNATLHTTCIACIDNAHSNAASGSRGNCKCNAGYTGADGESCAACITGKYKAENGSALCTSCSASKYSTTVGATSQYVCALCPENSYSTPASSMRSDCKCNTGYSGANTSTCVACEAGKYKTSNGTAECTNCLQGTYSTTVGGTLSSVCSTCPEHSNSPAASPNITACTCNTGSTGLDGGICYLCTPGKYKPASGSAACQDCFAGSYSVNYNATSNNTCVACVQNSYSHKGSFERGNCKCNAGYSGADGESCVACITGKYKPENGSALCTSCMESKYSTVVGATSQQVCNLCPENSYSKAASNMSSDCKCNTGYSGAIPNTCVVCEAGKYKISNGTAACASCVQGTYSTTVGAKLSSVCATCPENSNSPAASSNITACKCNAGSTGPDGGNCYFCTPGKYKPASGSAACQDCSAGTYSVHYNATSPTTCVACLQNSYSHKGSFERGNCKCNPGYSGADGESCVACITGKYKPENGSALCTSCTESKYSTVVGATSQQVCSLCPENSYSPLASRMSSDCKCNTGYSGAIPNTCVVCEAGKYKISNGTAACASCVQGTYSTTVGATLSSVCYTCPENSNSPAASSNITACKCNAGSTGLDGGNCYLCTPGKYKPASGSADCQNCLPGTYSITAGRTICFSCLVNSYSREASASKDSCKCNPGYSGADGESCVACVAGKFKTENGSALCTSCMESKYSTVVGATSQQVCNLCPENSYSTLASRVSSDCKCNTGYSGAIPNTCVVCEAGKYKISNGTAACASCVQGTYSTTVGATLSSVCYTCPENSNSPVASSNITACTCNAGSTGLDGGNCYLCTPGNYKPASGSAACQNCLAGTYSITTGRTMCVSCLVNSYSHEASASKNSCKCNAGYSGADGESCVACVAGKYKAENGSALCTSCMESKYSTVVGAISQQVCNLCPENSYSALASRVSSDCKCNAGYSGANITTCVVCEAGKYKISNGTAACASCVQGTYSTTVGATLSSVCYTCPENSNSPVASFNITACTCNAGSTGFDGMLCSVCTAGKYKLESGPAACQGCLAGKYSSITGAVFASVCLSCPVNSYSLAASSSRGDCKCNAGYRGGDGATCDACVPGKYKTENGSAECTNCTANTYSTTVGGAVQTVCSTCPEHSYSHTGSALLIYCKCNAGYSGPDGDTCSACIGGTYKVKAGSHACTQCVQGQYSTHIGATSDVCVECPPKSSASAGSDEQIDCICNAGWTGPDGTDCAACVAGSYKPSAGSSACTLCANHTYGTLHAAASPDVCVQCPTHSISVAGSDDISRCFCVLGFEQTPNHTTCVECIHGYYDDHTSRYSCSKCPGGYASVATRNIGLESCQPCPAGTWSNNLTASCQPCPSNSHSPPATTYIEDCVCNAGATGPDGHTCVLCIPGKYKSSKGSLACEDCSAGTYSVHYNATSHNTCAVCPSHSHSKPASYTINNCECNVGYIGTGEASCVLCAAGTKYINSSFCLDCPATSIKMLSSNANVECVCNAGWTGADGWQCTACAPGSYKIRTGSASCTLCARNTYAAFVGAISPSACTACPLRSASAEGSGNISMCVCASGYRQTIDHAACVECERGRYSDNLDRYACAECPIGTYKENTGAGACSACIPNSFSATGSTSPSNCLCKLGFRLTSGEICTACRAGTYKPTPGAGGCSSCPTNSRSLEASTSLRACVCVPGYYTDRGRLVDEWFTYPPFDRQWTFPGAWMPSGHCVLTTHAGSDEETCKQKCTSDPRCVAVHVTENSCVLATENIFEALAPAYGCLRNASRYAQFKHTLYASCTPCPSGTYTSETGGSVCTSCPVHSVAPDGSNSVQSCECNAGATVTANSTCSECVPGTYKDTVGSHACSSCDSGKYSEQSGAADAAACLVCADNSHSPTGSYLRSECTCNAGYSGADGEECAACAQGKYKTATGSAACDECLAGTYSATITGCDACPENSDSRAGSHSLSQCKCNAGYSGADGGECTACVAGKYRAADGGSTCTNCSVGTYSAAVGGAVPGVCRACVGNSSSQSGSSTCQCSPGYSGADGGECVECAAGKYKAISGSAPCTDCMKNSHSSEGRYSKSDCTCNSGFVLVDEEMCAACIIGMEFTDRYTCLHCTVSTNAHTVCTCDAGWSGPSGGPCTACTPGRYKNDTGSAPCTLCANHTYATSTAATSSNVCKQCPVHSTSAAGSTALLDCMCIAGWTGPNGGPCLEAQPDANVDALRALVQNVLEKVDITEAISINFPGLFANVSNTGLSSTDTRDVEYSLLVFSRAIDWNTTAALQAWMTDVVNNSKIRVVVVIEAVQPVQVLRRRLLDEQKSWHRIVFQFVAVVTESIFDKYKKFFIEHANLFIAGASVALICACACVCMCSCSHRHHKRKNHGRAHVVYGEYEPCEPYHPWHAHVLE